MGIRDALAVRLAHWIILMLHFSLCAFRHSRIYALWANLMLSLDLAIGSSHSGPWSGMASARQRRCHSVYITRGLLCNA